MRIVKGGSAEPTAKTERQRRRWQKAEPRKNGMSFQSGKLLQKKEIAYGKPWRYKHVTVCATGQYFPDIMVNS